VAATADPPPVPAPRVRAGGGPGAAADAAHRADVAHRAGTAALAGADTAAFPALVDRLDRAVLRSIAAVLHDTAGRRLGAAWTGPEVADAIGAAPRHRWIPGRWLADLAAAGLAERSGDRYAPPPRPRRAELTALRAELDTARAGLGYPPELTRYLRSTLSALPRLLRDETSSQELLFPDADPRTAEVLYRDNPVNRYLNAAAAAVVRGLTPADPAGLRVLELGAGIGATTAELLPALAGRTADYLFTDLSPFFLDQARERFADHPYLRCERLDFAADLPPGHGGLDLIVAANTAHNAPHAGRLLAGLRRLLAPGGTLLLVETCREHPQSLTSMPFLVSANPPRTDARAGTDRTYLSRAEWREAMAGAGLRPEVDLPPAGHPLTALSQRLLTARRPPENRSRR
jgi:SAM-dependent methyltransferase